MNDRVIALEGVRNFRDFGGYETMSGGWLKRGLLYRSGSFGRATDADRAALDGLGIALQADLRRPDERENDPGKWTAREVIFSDLGRHKVAPHVEFVQKLESSDPEEAEGWMRAYYREAPFRPALVESYTRWFDRLAGLGGDEAAVVNCAAGKDRTGLLCAFTKRALGVAEGDLVSDYLLTNEAAQVEARLAEATKMFNARTGRDHPADVYRPFLGVREVYYREAFAEIDRKTGGFEAYLRDVLGLTEAGIGDMRKRLVE